MRKVSKFFPFNFLKPVLALWLGLWVPIWGSAQVADSVDLAGLLEKIGDTQLSEIEIRTEFPYVDEGSASYRITENLLTLMKGQTLSDILGLIPGGFVKTYGSGSLATATLQGMSASQTQVTWMGIPVNSPSLGMTDLTLFPTELIGEITVKTGGGALASGSGGLGGEIAIEERSRYFSANKPYWMASIAAGSFGRYDGSFRFGKNWKGFSTETRFLYKQAENDFTFRDLTVFGTPEKTQSHAHFRQIGAVQNFKLRLSERSNLVANFWALDTEREIPPIMGTLPTEEQQHDRNLRASVSVENNLPKVLLSHSATYLNDINHYQNPTYGIDGLNRYQSGIFQSRISAPIDPAARIALSGYLRYRLDFSQTDGWEGQIGRKTATAYSKLGWIVTPKLDITASIQEENVDGKWMPFSPVLGLGAMCARWSAEKANHSIWLYGNVGRNYRIPTLNDLNWVPGGNSQLLPERSWKLQTGTRWVRNGKGGSKWNYLSLRVEGFANWVHDWILWQPSGLGYWQAQNVQQVFSRGGAVEWAINHGRSPQNLRSLREPIQWSVIGNYSFTLSEAIPAGAGLFSGEGHQLIYVPRHTVSINGIANWKRFRLNINPTYTGLRYITSDESQSLDPFFILNSIISFSLDRKANTWAISLRGENLLNKEYQAVAFRPMAGRAFMLRLDWNLDRNKIIN